MKTTKRTHCFASSYNVEILNSFNLDVQLKDTECAIKNKLKTLAELRRSKFMTILVLVLKKIESEEKNDSFYSHSKAEIIIN